MTAAPSKKPSHRFQSRRQRRTAAASLWAAFLVLTLGLLAWKLHTFSASHHLRSPSYSGSTTRKLQQITPSGRSMSAVARRGRDGRKRGRGKGAGAVRVGGDGGMGPREARVDVVTRVSEGGGVGGGGGAGIEGRRQGADGGEHELVEVESYGGGKGEWRGTARWQSGELGEGERRGGGVGHGEEERSGVVVSAGERVQALLQMQSDVERHEGQEEVSRRVGGVGREGKEVERDINGVKQRRRNTRGSSHVTIPEVTQGSMRLSSSGNTGETKNTRDVMVMGTVVKKESAAAAAAAVAEGDGGKEKQHDEATQESPLKAELHRDVMDALRTLMHSVRALEASVRIVLGVEASLHPHALNASHSLLQLPPGSSDASNLASPQATVAAASQASAPATHVLGPVSTGGAVPTANPTATGVAAGRVVAAASVQESAHEAVTEPLEAVASEASGTSPSDTDVHSWTSTWEAVHTANQAAGVAAAASGVEAGAFATLALAAQAAVQAEEQPFASVVRISLSRRLKNDAPGVSGSPDWATAVAQAPEAGGAWQAPVVEDADQWIQPPHEPVVSESNGSVHGFMTSTHSSQQLPSSHSTHGFVSRIVSEWALDAPFPLVDTVNVPSSGVIAPPAFDSTPKHAEWAREAPFPPVRTVDFSFSGPIPPPAPPPPQVLPAAVAEILKRADGGTGRGAADGGTVGMRRKEESEAQFIRAAVEGRVLIAGMVYNRVFHGDATGLWSLHVLQWLEYHRYAGVDRFYWYDEARSKREQQDAVLAPYVDAKLVRYHLVRELPGLRGKWSVLRGMAIRCRQGAAYNHWIQHYAAEVHWGFHIDIDEYFFSPPATPPGFLRLYLQSLPNTTVQVLVQNQFFLGDSLPTNSTATLLEQYTLRTLNTSGAQRTKPIAWLPFAARNPDYCMNPHKWSVFGNGPPPLVDAAVLRLNHYWGGRVASGGRAGYEVDGSSAGLVEDGSAKPLGVWLRQRMQVAWGVISAQAVRRERKQLRTHVADLKTRVRKLVALVPRLLGREEEGEGSGDEGVENDDAGVGGGDDGDGGDGADADDDDGGNDWKFVLEDYLIKR